MEDSGNKNKPKTTLGKGFKSPGDGLFRGVICVDDICEIGKLYGKTSTNGKTYLRIFISELIEQDKYDNTHKIAIDIRNIHHVEIPDEE